MKILEQIQKISAMGNSVIDKQKNINVSEVYHLWNHLQQRYYVIEITSNMENYVEDKDLSTIIGLGRKALIEQISTLEKEMKEYGIPLPLQPPKQTKIKVNVESISDRYIFRRILRGIQSFLPIHSLAFVHSTSPKIRELFKKYMIEEMNLYDMLLEYGKLKNYEIKPPAYRI